MVDEVAIYDYALTPHRVSYVANNPVRYSDPSGNCVGYAAFLLPACLGIGGYLIGNTAANAYDNWQSGEEITHDLGRGINAGDILISAGAGYLGGPISGAGAMVTRAVQGALAGCAVTFMSQAIGGRQNAYGETVIGCAAGALGSTPEIKSRALSVIFGFIVAIAQAIATEEQKEGRRGDNGAAVAVPAYYPAFSSAAGK